jgi:ankyrin repeat protein
MSILNLPRRLMVAFPIALLFARVATCETIIPQPKIERDLRKLNTPELIDQLTGIANSDVGYSSSISGSIFLPLDSEPSISTALLFQEPATKSLVMRELVARGAPAVPELLKRLGDKRTTKITVTRGLFGSFFVVDPDDEQKLDGSSDSHTVTVGDLCYVALGQIVNQPYAAVSHMPGRSVWIKSPTRSSTLRKALLEKWSGFNAEKHKAILLNDLAQQRSLPNRIEAAKRLSYYYPETLEPVVLKLLAQSKIGPRDLADLLWKGLSYDESEKIDKACRELLRATKDDDLALGCMRRLVGRGFDDDIKQYCDGRKRMDFHDEDLDEMLSCHGWSRLHVAVDRGHRERIEKWIADGKDISPQGKSGDTPLHVSVRRGELDLVMRLVEAKAKLDLRNGMGLCPVQMAVADDRIEIAQSLLKSGCAVPDILVASLAGKTETVAEFLKKDPKSIHSQTKQKWSPLHLAAWVGKTDVVSLLLTKGAEPNALAEKRWTPLHFAAMRGHEGAARELLAKNANVNCKLEFSNLQPLHLAYLAGDSSLAKLLIEHKADVDALFDNRGKSALILLAAEQGKLDFLQMFLSAGASVKLTNDFGETSLQLAAQRGDLKSVAMLMKHHSDVNAEANDGETALLHAVTTKNKEVVEFLLQHKAQTNAKSSRHVQDETPLRRAERLGASEIAELLRKYGAKK